MPDAVISLPWPPRELSANGRTDRRHNGAARRKYKADCWAAAKASNAKVFANSHLVIAFHPPDARRRDLDNMLSAIKYGLDGVAEAYGVDDYGWSLSIARGAKRPGGMVCITATQPQTQE